MILLFRGFFDQELDLFHPVLAALFHEKISGIEFIILPYPEIIPHEFHDHHPEIDYFVKTEKISKNAKKTIEPKIVHKEFFWVLVITPAWAL